ncbi:efflux RND transporter periplasmic adaptor subunit [Flavobacterium psychrophilum]|uniref:efflux RND transporter periplasmic adaptor subunit n=1 Tax=Flavobacterium psychrophilum TaxID=96345 RepID=UPI000B7C4DC9|nr:efflux RND transporter periplasmic adaptor subunit [Flavobacterium psychrophilum]SNB39283.1 putative membrane fusion efflux lipoprotein [Flavobacterium psychrophilum]
MKKIILIFTASILLFSCGQKEEAVTTDALIETKNVANIKAKRDLLQAEISKIDAALATLEVKTTQEALVSVLTVKDTVFNHYLEVQGNVNTKENILIQPEMPGTLVSLNVVAGQRVAKGQILGRTDDGGMGQQLASVENQYALARTTFERQKNLWDQKIGSEIQFLQAQTQMIGLQKAVLQMKAQLSKTLIKAPFTGVIDAVFVERGQVVSITPQGLMRIVNLSNMYVSTEVPETYIGKLKVGSLVNVSLTSLGKTYQGKVRQVGNNINPANRSFGIEVWVPNPGNLLRPNQVAKLQIIDYTKKNAIVVPTNTIQANGDGTKFVYIANNVNGKTGIAKKVVVTTGQSSENVTEILSGIKTTDIIITEGINTIQEGTKLNF